VPEWVELAHERWTNSRDHQKDWREEARELYDLVAGKQWTDEEMAYLNEQMRSAITMNRIGPMVQAVVGHQVINRQEIKYLPREQGDVEANEVLTGAAQWADDECDGEDEITDAFNDLVTCGMGWTETRISYDQDTDGKIHTAERIDPFEMFWDPTAKKRNLSDARYVVRGRWIPRKEAEERWPDIKSFDPVESEIYADDLEDDNQPHDATRAFLYENNAGQWYREKDDHIFVMQYQWWEHDPVYRVGDPQSGKLVELSHKKFTKLKGFIDMHQMRYVKQMKRRYYDAFLMGKHVLEKKDCTCPFDFTLKAMTGLRDRNRNYWYGIVKPLKDPQKWANKFYSDTTDILSRNRKGGAFVEEGALKDPRKAEEDWNSPDALIILNDGAISGSKVQERGQAQYPDGMGKLMEYAIRAIPDVSGLNLELLGMVDRNQPGILEAQRKQASLTILATLFDALRRHTKERGRIVLHFIKEYIADGRLVRIIGKNGMEQYVPLVQQNDARFDTVVDQSPTSPNQKMETFAILREIMPLALNAGLPVPLEILDYIPLPSSLTNSWKKDIQQRSQSQQQNPETLAKVDKDESQAELNRAKAESEKAKVPLEIAKQKNDQQKIMLDAVK